MLTHMLICLVPSYCGVVAFKRSLKLGERSRKLNLIRNSEIANFHSFILVVNHIRAAHRALDADSKILHANQAQMVGQGFLTAYPDSLRAAAVRRLLERLPSID